MDMERCIFGRMKVQMLTAGIIVHYVVINSVLNGDLLTFIMRMRKCVSSVVELLKGNG